MMVNITNTCFERLTAVPCHGAEDSTMVAAAHGRLLESARERGHLVAPRLKKL
jgi:hypothetical protein